LELGRHHIPAYLVNVLLALDPLPLGDREDLKESLGIARELLERATTLILEKFPDKNPQIPYANERFLANWEPDHDYSWQQNRAVVGHNFKIAWNLTRVANYYNPLARDLAHCQSSSDARTADALSWTQHYEDLATRCTEMAERLCKSMTEVGIDQVRGGHSDASGYHCFELNYLAHIYNRAYVALENGTDASFCLYFKPDRLSGMRSINVLPDFMPPGSVQIERVIVNGEPQAHSDPNHFQIELTQQDLGADIVVHFRAAGKAAHSS
jgi:hypothetical protein